MEQLPLPLLLRDRQGRIIGTNQRWREQINQREWQLTYSPLGGVWRDLELVIARPADEIDSDRLKTEFLACIDHELKSPLTSVIGIASLLNQQAIGKLNQKQSRYVQLIHQSGRHLMEIINMILDLVQASGGQLQLELEPVEILAICQASIKQTKKWLEQEAYLHKRPAPRLNVHLDIAEGLESCIADALRLQQMLANLLSNACKFSCPPDQELLAVDVLLQVQQWGKWLTFTVSDRGIGIPADQQHLICQRFQQVDSSLMRRYGGTGLGLVLTRQLARLHGGDISFISQAGVGSKFTILLPAEQPEANATVSQLVLVASTDPQEIDRLVKIVETAGYWAVTARNGVEAIEKIRQLQPMASIMRSNLPLLSAWDVRAVLQNHMILICSDDRASHSPELVQSFLDKACQQPIGKPQRPLTLLYIHHFLEEQTVRILEELGYCLIEASDLEQACILGNIWHPDLFLTDRACPEGLDVPCLVIAPHSSPQAITTAIQTLNQI